MKKTRILFICKIRNTFYGPSFGLINSCRFISNGLNSQHIESKVVSVIDNSNIDKEVSDYKPTHVFIEALWVVPSKFEELIPLHPTVKWYVRIHSKIPFLASEGMAVEWLREYYELSKRYPQLHIASNSREVVDSFERCFNIPVKYFPNIYSPPYYQPKRLNEFSEKGGRRLINIGCFGAVRPLKNHLNQAIAAIIFGDQIKAKINFHINSDRCETGGDPVLRNLTYLFKDTPHKLIYNPWMNHEDFISLVKSMDLGMQVSLSETFNIVAADFAWNNVPLIGSSEINWLDDRYKADPGKIESIIDVLHFANTGKKHNIQKVNLKNLEEYNKESIKVWLNEL